jgi:hypothetical protein
MPRTENKPPNKRTAELKMKFNDYIDENKFTPYVERIVDFFINKIIELEDRIDELSKK